MRNHVLRFLPALAASVTLAAPVCADALKPASFLLFAEFNNTPGNLTFLTLTNVNADLQSGAIDVHLVYIDASNCHPSDRIEHLTARDTDTFLASFHVPGIAKGYAYAYATDPILHKSIDFDYLIGTVLRVDAVNAVDYSFSALPFQALTGAGNATDVNFNGRPDLDGVEYEKAHNHFFVPRFFGQSPPPIVRGQFQSELVLLQPLVNQGVTTTAGFLIYNDNEEVFSGQFAFQCWTRVPLLSISGAFAQTFLAATNQNPNEVGGAPFIESGWFDANGVTASSPQGNTPNPPLFGVLIEMKPESAADLPFVDNP